MDRNDTVAGVLTEHYSRWFLVGIQDDGMTVHYRFSGDDAEDEERAEGYMELTEAVHRGLVEMDERTTGFDVETESEE